MKREPWINTLRKTELLVKKVKPPSSPHHSKQFLHLENCWMKIQCCQMSEHPDTEDVVKVICDEVVEEDSKTRSKTPARYNIVTVQDPICLHFYL